MALHPALNILPDDVSNAAVNLFAEVSDRGFSYILQNEDEKKFIGMSVFEFPGSYENADAGALLKDIFGGQKIFARGFKSVVILFALNESVLIPDIYYDAALNAENVNRVFGDVQQGVILNDHVAGKDLHAVYRVPLSVYEAISSQFPSAILVHQYSAIAKQLTFETPLLKVIFYKHKIVVALAAGGRLQIIQTFFYTTPEDVVYHMLNVCDQIDISELAVELSGVIDKDSALSKKVHSYFTNIHFAGLSGRLRYAEKINQLPHHLFSHLFSLALCV